MQTPDDLKNIVRVALSAVGRGARGMVIGRDAVELVRDRFAAVARGAVTQPRWRRKWDRERCYLVGSAEALGQCAARLATDDRRRAITSGDVESAMMKLRGRMPIAGRWCPF